MAEKRERTFYRVYEVDGESGNEEFYAEAEGPDALAEARNYAAEIDPFPFFGVSNHAAVYKVTEVEERIEW